MPKRNPFIASTPTETVTRPAGSRTVPSCSPFCPADPGTTARGSFSPGALGKLLPRSYPGGGVLEVRMSFLLLFE